MPEPLIARWNAEQAATGARDLRGIYAAAYAEPPYHKGPADAEHFAQRLHQQAGLPGFSFVAAVADGAVIGFAFGRRFDPGQWWYGAELLPSAELIGIAKFAVSELVIASPYRGRRLATHLMRELLGDRTEPYATLLSRPGSLARRIYQHWGWVPVGTARARPDLPANDALVLVLPWISAT